MKAFRDWNFNAKQTFAVTLLLLLIFGSLFLWMRRESHRLLDDQINRTALAQVEVTAEKINSGLLVVETAAREFAATLEALPREEPLQRRLLEESFRRLHARVPALCGISIAYTPEIFLPDRKYYMLYVQPGADGTVEVTQIGGPDHRYDRFDWFLIPKLLNRPIWTEPYFDTFAECTMTTRAQPLYSEGRFIGITGFDLSLRGIEKSVAAADAYGYGEEFLLSRFGRFIVFPDHLRTTDTSTDGEWVSRAFNTTIFSLADFLDDTRFGFDDGSVRMQQIGREMLEGRSGFVTIPGLGGKGNSPERLYYAPVSAPHWSVGVAYSEQELAAPLHQLEHQLGLLALAGMLLMYGAVTIANRHLCRPLQQLEAAARSIGGGNFHTQLPPVGGEDEIGRLNRSFSTMQRELGEYMEKLRETTAVRQKIESELEVARQIQQGILPKMLPPLPDTREFSLFAALHPARAVGGDLYDFFLLDEQRYCFIIGDVSGKGVPAALFMAITQTLQRSEAERFCGTGELVGRINDLLVRNNDSMMFVTYFLGVLDLRNGTVEYTNAGHNPPYVLRSNGALELLTSRHGPALGIMEHFRYGSGTITLTPEDTLVLYTDGITEAMDADQHMFGVEALQRVLAGRGLNTSPTILGDEILAAVDRFSGGVEQADDITLLILRRKLS